MKYDVVKPIIQFFNKYKINIDGKMDTLKTIDPGIFNSRLATHIEHNDSVDS